MKDTNSLTPGVIRKLRNKSKKTMQDCNAPGQGEQIKWLNLTLMTTFRFDYKINNFRDIHFNYNIDVNVTSIWQIFTMNERLKGK